MMRLHFTVEQKWHMWFVHVRGCVWAGGIHVRAAS